MQQKLPTWGQVRNRTMSELDKASRGLSDARDELRSDFSTRCGPGRVDALERIAEAKNAIEQAKNSLNRTD